MRLFIPFNKIQCSHQPSWFTANIRDHIKCLQIFQCRYKRHPTEFLKEKIKSSEESLQEEIFNSKANYELYLIREFASNYNNNIFKYIRNLTQSSGAIPLLYILTMLVLNLILIVPTCLIVISILFSLTHPNNPMLK